MWGAGSVTEEDFRVMTDFMLTAVRAHALPRLACLSLATPPP